MGGDHVSFTGAWRQGAYLQPDQAVTHTADPAHAEIGDDDGVQQFTYQTAPMDDPGELGPEYPGMEYVVNTRGTIIDTTPVSHERDDVDHGADEKGWYEAPDFQFSDEKYEGARFEGLDMTQEINPVVLERGLNGLPANNPEGIRRGWIEQQWVNRRFAVASERQHDHRVVFPDVATFGADTPPVSEGPYPTAHSFLARAITNINQSPEDRREPPPMLRSQITDGSPYESPVSDAWVVG